MIRLEDYTYPELVGTDGLPDDREKARLQLQKRYGLEVEYWNAGHRHYVIIVELLEHAFDGPYTLKIFESATGSNVILGSVTVFARPDDSPCEGCSRRRANGSVVRGIIPVPRNVVDAVRDMKIADESRLHEAIKSKFKGVLVNPRGTLLGRAEPIEGDLPDGQRSLPRHLAPMKVRLVSSVAQRADGEKPVRMFCALPSDASFLTRVFCRSCGPTGLTTMIYSR